MARKLKRDVLDSIPYLNEYVQRNEGITPQGTTKQLKSSVLDSIPYLKQYVQPTVSADDIGPVKKKWYDGYFQKGVFEDGYQFGDFTRSLVGTVADLSTDATAGAASIVENTIDAGASLLSIFGNEDRLAEFIAKDIIDEQGLAKELSPFNLLQQGRTKGGILSSVEDLAKWRDTLQNEGVDVFRKQYMEDLGIDGTESKSELVLKAINYLMGGKDSFQYETTSVLGDESDAIAQSGGQLATQFALQGVGVPWWVTSAVTSYGSTAEREFQGGSTSAQANITAAITAGAEVLFEKISGAIPFQGKALDSGITDLIARGISNKLLKTGLKLGLDFTGEGLEEVLSEAAGKFGHWLTHQDEGTLWDALTNEQAFEDYLRSFIAGGFLGGGSSSVTSISNAIAGRDPVSGLNSVEEQVVRDLFDSRVSDAESEGNKLSGNDKSKIWDDIITQMDRGEIAIDDIERILGGDTYKTYNDIVTKEDALFQEHEALGNKENATPADTKRYMELDQKVADVKENSKRSDLAKQLQSEVFSVAKDSRLAESYNERVKKGQAFEADVSKYSESERKTIQDAIDSGILNNTRKTHEFVDWVAKVAGAKGLEFKFTNNENLRGTQFEVKTEDGKTRLPNGYRQGNTIGINTNSKKNVNVVAGHEITHVLEGSALYQALQDAVFRYAVAKDGQAKFDQRLKEVEQTYKGVTEDAKGELTADLVGEYLFTDKDFIKRLTTENKSLAQKVFDEIKYMWKWATAGSREKRELERVKKAFEDAYREVGKESNKSDVQHSLSDDSGNDIKWEDLTIDDVMKMSYEDVLQLEDILFDEDTIREILSEDDTTAEDVAEEMDAEPDVINILFRRSGLGDTHVEDNNMAVMTQSRIDQRIHEHGASNPDYARAYITRISPKDFIDLTVLEKNRDRAQFDTKVTGDFDGLMSDWDYEQALRDKAEPPTLSVDKTTGKIIGHNGRHRVRALEMAGIESVEIEVEFYEDYRLVKYDAQTIPDMAISSQFDTAIETHISNIIPLNNAHRAEIMESYGENAHENAGIKYSLGDSSTRHGNYHVTGEDITIQSPFEVEEVAPVADNVIDPQKGKTESRVLDDKAAEDHFIKSQLSFDKLSPEVQEKIGGRWRAIQKATRDAVSFVKNGADGVRPLREIFDEANKSGDGQAFDDYLLHRLNIDRMTLSSRFNIGDKPVFGEGVSSTFSQQKVAEIESAHPEFVELANEVYSYNTYLKDLLVKGGVISQETADLWSDRYPHYVPIKRKGFGDENHISDLFDFVANQEGSPLDVAEVEAFFVDVENEVPIKEAVGGEKPIKSLADTMSDRALQTFWTLAMRGVDTTISSQVAESSEVSQNQDVRSEEELARYKPTPIKERSILLRDGRNNFTKSVQEHILDSGYVFEKISKKTGNRNLEAKWNFRRNSGSMAQRLIDNGDAKHGVPSLKKMFKDLKKAGKIEAFSHYLGHQAHVDGMTLQSRYVLANNRSFMGDDVSVHDSLDAIAQLEAEHPEFKSLAEGVYRYTDFLMDQLVDNGIISEDDAELWREILPHWIPTKDASGKGRILDALGKYTANVYKAITTNSFSGELFETLNSQDGRERIDIEGFMARMESGEKDIFAPTQNNGRYQYTVYENGERVTYEVNEEMYEALKPRHVALQKSIPVLSHFNSFFRAVTTQYNPVFAATNAIKDFQDVIINSQHAGKTYTNILSGKALWQIATKGKEYQEYLANGGDTNTRFNSREGAFAEDPKAKKVLDKIFFLNDVIETVPRLAEYMASRDSGRSIEVSMLDAARVTTNFSAGGDVTKFFNRNGCTFLNASVQGALQQVRNVQEAHQKGAMGYVSLVTRCAIGGLLPVILNNLIWDDDEEYEQLADYVKEGYYIVGKTDDGKFIRIPKGRTLAVLQEAIDIVMDTATGDDEVDLARFMALGSLALENIAPNNPIENNIFAPVMQTFYNRTWYGEELVPERLSNLPYAEQFDEKTDSISKWLAQTTLGQAFNWSPYKINYLLNTYSGGIGDVILPMLTPRSESGDDSLLGKLTAPLRDKFVTDSVLNSQIVTDFYDVCDELERNANSMHATEADAFKYMYIESVCFDTNELYAEKRAIQNSDMSDSEKYHRVREIQEEINAMMEEALNSYQNPQIDGLYAEVGSKRFNYDEESGNWYPIRETNADGSPNWYYEMEQKVTQGLGISYGEYWNNREEYNFAYEKPGKYAVSQAVGGYEDYQTYTSEMWDIHADKDENGQSINGTRKKKVIEYVNGLDCEYGMKIILYKSEYPNDDEYNYDIIEYLNSRDDISYEQMETILKELGFNVSSDGRITW